MKTIVVRGGFRSSAAATLAATLLLSSCNKQLGTGILPSSIDRQALIKRVNAGGADGGAAAFDLANYFAGQGVKEAEYYWLSVAHKLGRKDIDELTLEVSRSNLPCGDPWVKPEAGKASEDKAAEGLSPGK